MKQKRAKVLSICFRFNDLFSFQKVRHSAVLEIIKVNEILSIIFLIFPPIERQQINERPSRKFFLSFEINFYISPIEPKVLDVESVFKVNNDEERNWVEGIIKIGLGY
jgi:hypothetical protein